MRIDRRERDDAAERSRSIERGDRAAHDLGGLDHVGIDEEAPQMAGEEILPGAVDPDLDVRAGEAAHDRDLARPARAAQELDARHEIEEVAQDWRPEPLRTCRPPRRSPCPDSRRHAWASAVAVTVMGSRSVPPPAAPISKGAATSAAPASACCAAAAVARARRTARADAERKSMRVAGGDPGIEDPIDPKLFFTRDMQAFLACFARCLYKRNDLMKQTSRVKHYESNRK